MRGEEMQPSVDDIHASRGDIQCVALMICTHSCDDIHASRDDIQPSVDSIHTSCDAIHIQDVIPYTLRVIFLLHFCNKKRHLNKLTCLASAPCGCFFKVSLFSACAVLNRVRSYFCLNYRLAYFFTFIGESCERESSLISFSSVPRISSKSDISIISIFLPSPLILCAFSSR